MTAHTIALLPGTDRPEALIAAISVTEHPCGLLTYRVHDDIEPDSAYRWRIGHHSGLAVAAAITEADIIAAVPILAPLADWTADVATLRDALPGGPPAGVWDALDEHNVIHPRYR